MKSPNRVRLLQAMSNVGLVAESDSHMDRIVTYTILTCIAKRARQLDRAAIRGLTRRQFAYWRKNMSTGEIAEQLRSLGISADSPDAELLEARKRLLLQLLRFMMPQTGRPKKPRGGIMSARPKRLSGRPLSVPLDEEQQWVRAAMGVKMALWAQRERIAGMPFPSVLERLARSGGLKELSESISDAEALRSTWLADRNPPAKTQDALRKRFNRARKGYKLPE